MGMDSLFFFSQFCMGERIPASPQYVCVCVDIYFTHCHKTTFCLSVILLLS